MKKRIISRVGSEAQYGPRLAGEILHDYLENSNEPLAVAYREHHAETEIETNQLFRDVHPDTFLSVNLKLLTRQPGRMEVSEMCGGVITRDDEDHFTFIQDIIEQKTDYARNPHVYSGKHINVIRKKDGELCPTFNRPRYTNKFTFQDLCRESAKELLIVAGLIEE